MDMERVFGFIQREWVKRIHPNRKPAIGKVPDGSDWVWSDVRSHVVDEEEEVTSGKSTSDLWSTSPKNSPLRSPSEEEGRWRRSRGRGWSGGRRFRGWNG